MTRTKKRDAGHTEKRWVSSVLTAVYVRDSHSQPLCFRNRHVYQTSGGMSMINAGKRYQEILSKFRATQIA